MKVIKYEVRLDVRCAIITRKLRNFAIDIHTSCSHQLDEVFIRRVQSKTLSNYFPLVERKKKAAETEKKRSQ